LGPDGSVRGGNFVLWYSGGEGLGAKRLMGTGVFATRVREGMGGEILPVEKEFYRNNL